MTARTVHDRMPWRTAIAGALLFLGLAGAARAQCWTPSPDHLGTKGCTTQNANAGVVWVLDGVTMYTIATSCGVESWIHGQWVLFGGAPSGKITSLAVYNGRLYAGGTFTKIGTDAVYNVAVWDGSAHWLPLGDGFTGAGDPRNPGGIVNAMVIINGVLWIGGSMTPVDTGTWTSWSTWNDIALTPGLPTQAVISGITTLNNQVYVSTTAGVPGVWRYDTSVWTRMGTLADKNIWAIANYQNTLVVGGEFTHFFTGTSIVGVAQFDGTNWQPMGAGISPPGSIVKALAQYGSDLYAGGVFTKMDNQTVNNIAQWDGASWSPLGAGLTLYDFGFNGGVAYLGTFDNELDALGEITQCGAFPDSGIARWTGSIWLPFTGGLDDEVHCFLPGGIGIDVGGSFECVVSSGQTAEHILGADTSGTSGAFTDLGGFSGPNGVVTAMANLPNHIILRPPTLVVGGGFTSVAGTTALNVAQYGNGEWAALGGGLNAEVTSLAYFNSAMYAAGGFTADGSNTVALPHLAKLGSTWSDPGLGAFNVLYALLVANGQLLIGGVPGGEGVSAWDGTTLSTLGNANGPVLALATLNGDLIAAGAFSSIGGVAAQCIARRDHVTGAWSPLGYGFGGGIVFALAVVDNRLFAGGSFQSSGGTRTRSLAEWTGSTWDEAAGGVDGIVYALASWNNRLQVGGSFQQANSGVLSPYWIQHQPGGCDAGVASWLPAPDGAAWSLSAPAPNPSRRASTVTFTLAQAAFARAIVVDAAGRRVRTLEARSMEAGAHTLTWDGADDRGRACSAGVYFVRLEADGRTASRAVVRVR